MDVASSQNLKVSHSAKSACWWRRAAKASSGRQGGSSECNAAVGAEALAVRAFGALSCQGPQATRCIGVQKLYPRTVSTFGDDVLQR